MSTKMFYWLKLHKDFFKSREMKKLRRIAGGDTYTIIYLKLQLLSLENEGFLYFEGVDDSFCEELALEIDEDAINVEATFTYLIKVGLLEMVKEDQLKLPHVIDNLGKETPSASRKRRQRERENQQATQKSVTMSQDSHAVVTDESRASHNSVTTEIETYKEKKIENREDKEDKEDKIENPSLSFNIDSIVSFWKEKRGDNVIVDAAITRMLTKSISEYGVDIIKGSIDKYDRALRGEEFWWSHTYSLFDFVQNGLVKFIHVSDDLSSMRKGEKKASKGSEVSDEDEWAFLKEYENGK